jgi:hypothetical protein
MGGPAGNQHALGNKGGRPGHDRLKIGHDFVKFVSENRYCVTVPMFGLTIGVSSDTMLTWCDECEEFRQLYHKAKEIIGVNRFYCTQESSEIKIEASLYRGTLWHYDYDVKHDLRQEKAFESSLRKDEDSSNSKQPIHVNVTSALASGINVPSSTISNTDNNSSK